MLKWGLGSFPCSWGCGLGRAGDQKPDADTGDLCVHLDVDVQSHWKVKVLTWLSFCGFLSFFRLCVFFPFCWQASFLALPLGRTLSLLPWPVAGSASSSSSRLPLWSHHSQHLLSGQSLLSPLLSWGSTPSHHGTCLDCECSRWHETTGLPAQEKKQHLYREQLLRTFKNASLVSPFSLRGALCDGMSNILTSQGGAPGLPTAIRMSEQGEPPAHRRLVGAELNPLCSQRNPGLSWPPPCPCVTLCKSLTSSELPFSARCCENATASQSY